MRMKVRVSGVASASPHAGDLDLLRDTDSNVGSLEMVHAGRDLSKRFARVLRDIIDHDCVAFLAKRRSAELLEEVLDVEFVLLCGSD